MVLAPEHELVKRLKNEIKNWSEVEKYINEVKNKTEIERTAEEKDKTGIELKGIKAINPGNQEEIPVFIADYVLANYGTGAIMAVPGHDERDYAFAKKYNLPIRRVIEPKFVNKEGDATYREKDPYIKRECVCVVVRNPKDDTFLCVSWKKFKMNGLVTG
jgi:leucyl-tRNA synthetase